MEIEVLERGWEKQDDDQNACSPDEVEMHEGLESEMQVDHIKLEKDLKLEAWLVIDEEKVVKSWD